MSYTPMTRSSCVSSANNLDNPDIFLLVLHLTSITGIPIYLYGFYCILVITPPGMKSLKWILFASHGFSCLLDACIGLVVDPYLYYPTMAGHMLGIIDSPVQIFVSLSLLAVVGVTIMTVFENRYYILYGEQKKWWSKVRKPFLAANFLLAAVSTTPAILTIPDQDLAFEIVSKSLPCQPERFLNNRKIFILAVDYTIPLFCGGLMTTVIFWEIVGFSGTIFWKIAYGRRTAALTSSKNTINLQNRMVFALSIQMLIPFLMAILPLIYPFLAICLNYHNQWLNNAVVCICALHGFVSSIIMVLVHQPYRKTTLRMLHNVFLFCCK